MSSTNDSLNGGSQPEGVPETGKAASASAPADKKPAADAGAKPTTARPRRGAIGGRPPEARKAGPGGAETAEPADIESAPTEPRQAGPGVAETAGEADIESPAPKPRQAGPGVAEKAGSDDDKPAASEPRKAGPGVSETADSSDGESVPPKPRQAGPGVSEKAGSDDDKPAASEPRKAGPGGAEMAESSDKKPSSSKPRKAGPAVAAGKPGDLAKAEPAEPGSKTDGAEPEAAKEADAVVGSSDPTQVIGPPRTSIKPVSAPPPPEPTAPLTPRQSIAAILAGPVEPAPQSPPADDATSTKVLPATSAQAEAGQTPPTTAAAAAAAPAATTGAKATEGAKPKSEPATPPAPTESGSVLKASPTSSAPASSTEAGADTKASADTKAGPTSSSAPASSTESGSAVKAGPASSSALTPPTKPSPTTAGPDAEDEPKERKPRRAVRIILPLLVLMALVGAYGALSAYLGQRVPAETTVGGVAIGSLPIEEAVTKLETELGTRLSGPIPVTVGPAQAELDPVVAGIVFDARATVEGITGLSFNPSTLWTAIRGLGPVEPIMRVDQAALSDELNRLADRVAVEPVDGTISVTTGVVEVTEPVVGLDLDVDQAAALPAVTWLTEQRPLALPFTEPVPDVTDEVLAEAKTRLADPLLSGPVIVEVAGKRIEVPVDVLAKAATLRWTDGRMALDLDRAAITASVKAREPEGLETEPVNAEFGWEDGHPVILDGQVGTTLDVESIVAAVVEAATKTDDRTADVALIEIEPTRDRTALEELGINEVVADPICTYAPPSWARDGNLDKAAGILTGIVVMPGETFSLDEALGHRSAETGWFNAGVMVGGVHKDDIGGGLSQISTTIYNMAFWAGFELVEHTTHSEWFSRYPMGREATLWEGYIDNKFRNNTPYAAMLHVWHSGTDICGEVWSTKYYRINAWTGEPYNYVSPTTIHKPEGPDCSPQSAGNAGFDVVDHRQVFLLETDELVTDESISTHYSPYNAYVCDPPPSPDPPPAAGG